MTRWVDAGATTTRLPSDADRRSALRLTDTARSLVATARAMPNVMARTRDHAPGQPKAANYDGVRVSGGRSQLWCWAHERNLTECTRAGLACDGDPIPVNDPAGEAAIGPDPSADLLRRIRAATSKAEAAARELAELVASATMLRPPTDRDLRDTAHANQSTPGCEWCASVPAPSGGPAWWNEVGPGLENYTAGGTIPAAAVCSGCYRFFVTRGRRPTKTETTAKRDTGKWPGMHDAG